MGNIIISGQEFNYKTKFCVNEIDTYEWTEFYKESMIVHKRKYGFFGKVIPHEVPIMLFKVNFNIESPFYTKDEVRKKLEYQVELLSRKEQIKRGEII
jgi:hypothetical protein